MTFVPDTTRVRPSRVHNIDSDRLARRLRYLNSHWAELARSCDSRLEVRHLARERVAIRRELARRSPMG